MFRHLIVLSFGGLFVLSQSGCGKKEEITRYTVPKPHVVYAANHVKPKARQKRETPDETIKARMLAAIFPQGAQTWFFKVTGADEAVLNQVEPFLAFIKSVRFSGEGNPKPKWVLPQGWSRVPESSRDQNRIVPRFATLQIGSEGLELTVIPLSTATPDFDESVFLNVIRWRGQLGLPRIPKSQLYEKIASQETIQTEVNGAKVALVTLIGNTVANRPNHAPFAPARRPSPVRPSRVRPLAKPQLTYDVPQGWSPGQVRGMRQAAFNVIEGERKVEITVFHLPASGPLANVNRWRGLIQLPKTTQQELDRDIKKIKVGQVMGDSIELIGPQTTTLGVIVADAANPGKIWVFKLGGDPQLAAREKKRFEDFVQSVRFPAADGSSDGK